MTDKRVLRANVKALLESLRKKSKDAEADRNRQKRAPAPVGKKR